MSHDCLLTGRVVCPERGSPFGDGLGPLGPFDWVAPREVRLQLHILALGRRCVIHKAMGHVFSA